jgi:hypothetical protein
MCKLKEIGLNRILSQVSLPEGDGWLALDRVMEVSVTQISTDLDKKFGLVSIET